MSALVENLRKGTIYIQETAVPEHLILDTTIRNTTINVNETTSYTATNNWKQGYIKVVKKDAEKKESIEKTQEQEGMTEIKDDRNSKNP